MSLTAWVLIFVILTIVAIMMGSADGDLDMGAPQVLLIGISGVALGLAVLGALILGIVGLFEKNKKRLFAILGTTLSGTWIFFFLMIMIIGGLA